MSPLGIRAASCSLAESYKDRCSLLSFQDTGLMLMRLGRVVSIETHSTPPVRSAHQLS